MQKWKLLEETDVSPSKWFPILKRKFELPNGKIVDDFFISTLEDVVMVLPVTSQKKIVFVKQFKPAIDKIIIELPSGVQQDGKTLEESALAELEEETGIKTTQNNLNFFSKTANNPTKTTQIIYCYFAKGLIFNSKQKLDVTEDIEILQIFPKEALDMVLKGDIWGSETVCCILKASYLFPELFA
jgi:8-oxo-dGTP pyrophosphatase MutT (NUDIX family)